MILLKDGSSLCAKLIKNGQQLLLSFFLVFFSLILICTSFLCSPSFSEEKVDTIGQKFIYNARAREHCYYYCQRYMT